MNEEIRLKVKDLHGRLLHMWDYLDLEEKQQRLFSLETVMEKSDFWLDREKAQKTIEESNRCKAWLCPYREIKKRFGDVKDLLLSCTEEEDPAFYQELLGELESVEKGVEALELRKMLSGELDESSCYLSINAGAGGTESCDWAAMLARMYERFVAKKGWKIRIVERLDGDVAGIKNILYHVEGAFAYGYCRAEKGVHRLVRISPFDSNARRHTSFASVDVIPEIDEAFVEAIQSEDIQVDTFRASGAGGQHVNVTDSAVRITHLKTGIVVSCQSERSQLQNKETCLKLLRSKLYEKQMTERLEKLAAIGGEKKAIAWGSQARNYVCHPYTLVKDTRTKYEETHIQKVLDGDLDPFIFAFLKECQT